MNIFVKSLFAALALSAPALPGAAQQVPDAASRIMWDVASRQVIFPSGNYSRLIPLQDGRLLAVKIFVCRISVADYRYKISEKIAEKLAISKILYNFALAKRKRGASMAG